MSSNEHSSTRLLAKIYNSINSAPKAMGRIAAYVARNPEKILAMSVSELAEYTESGSATIVRFCRMLGFKGFRDFKISLSAEIERERNHPFLENDLSLDPSLPSKTARTVFSFQASILESAKKVDFDQLQQIAIRLKNAKNIAIYGGGASSICADLLSFRLTYMGLTVHSPSASSMPYAIINSLGESSIAIAISYRGFAEWTLGFMKKAREKGAYTIAITTRTDNPLALEAEETLCLSAVSSELEINSVGLMPSIMLLTELISQEIREI